MEDFGFDAFNVKRDGRSIWSLKTWIPEKFLKNAKDSLFEGTQSSQIRMKNFKGATPLFIDEGGRGESLTNACLEPNYKMTCGEPIWHGTHFASLNSLSFQIQVLAFRVMFVKIQTKDFRSASQDQGTWLEPRLALKAQTKFRVTSQIHNVG